MAESSTQVPFPVTQQPKRISTLTLPFGDLISYRGGSIFLRIVGQDGTDQRFYGPLDAHQATALMQLQKVDEVADPEAKLN